MKRNWKKDETNAPDFRQGIMAEAIVIRDNKFLYYGMVNEEIKIIDESKIPNAVKSTSRDFINPLWTGF